MIYGYMLENAAKDINKIEGSYQRVATINREFFIQ